MSSLRVPIIENNNFVTDIYFIFLKTRLRSNLKCFNTKFGTQYKDRKISYQVKQILSLLCNLVTVILD